MNKLLNFFKNNRISVPIWLGLVINKLPYHRRPGIGRLYKQQQIAIQNYSVLTEYDRKLYIYNNFMKIFVHAYENIPFYKELYTKHNISPKNIKSYDDIQKVPIIRKEDLVKYDIENRSYPVKNRLIVNTGGSSGKSLVFYMDPNRYGNEWAHIHNMWARLGFKPSKLKLSFDGRVKKEHKIVYDFARNSLLFDIYVSIELVRNQLFKFFKRYPVEYFHGYPSAIYEFALYCEKDIALLNMIKKHLKGVFLSSEYPSPHYRKKIEEVFNVSTQSFYGHTETCVMAVEDIKFEYDVYQTYGYAEAIECNGSYHLVGTSYFNFASPLIRYDTSDLIEPIETGTNILEKFKIKEGRLGEFVLDKNNNKIPLTGLIYGRHHKLFNVSEHLQIFQPVKGEMIIIYTTSKEINENDAKELFDSSSVDIIVSFKKVAKPILTKSGKINLLVNKEQFEDII